MVDEIAEREMALLQEVAVAIRTLRSTYSVPPSWSVAAEVRVPDPAARALIEKHRAIIEQSARVNPTISEAGGAIPQSARQLVRADIEVVVPLKGLVDIDAERARIEKEISKAEKEIASLEKKRLRDQQRRLLHTFTSKEVAETLVAEGFSLGGKRIDASIMFTDIRSFTTISEGKDPAETIDLLNRYFAVVFEPISRYGGIVNQIIGDGMMALFGITRRSVVSASNVDHRQHAVLAAIAILDALQHFNAQQGAANQTQLEIGIGIASGSVIAGYAGTQHRATYTCVGDTVNVAARLEAHTKVVDRPILIDENTRLGLDDAIAVEEQGDLGVKGKTRPVKVYAVQVDSLAAKTV